MKPLSNTLLRAGIVAALIAGTAACNRAPDTGSATVASSTAVPVAAVPVANPAAPVAPGVAPPPPGYAPDYAQVIAVNPVRTNGAPRQVCQNVVVTQQVPPQDQHQVAGTAIGAVLGGVLGNAVGHGRGRTLATVAGAVGGGYAGNRIEASRQQNNVTQTVQTRCHDVPGGSRIVAYDVRYMYDGVQRTVRLDHDPGNRLPMRGGVVALPDAR